MTGPAGRDERTSVLTGLSGWADHLPRRVSEKRSAVEMLGHAQFMCASAERWMLCNDDPFAVCIGPILGQLLVAIEQDDPGPRAGHARRSRRARPARAGRCRSWAWLRSAVAPRAVSPSVALRRRPAGTAPAPLARSRRPWLPGREWPARQARHAKLRPGLRR